MTSNDYEVIAYKVLSYLYACIKVGKHVDIPVMRELVGCNEAYLGVIVKGLQDDGYVRGFFFDGVSGVIMDSPNIAAIREPAITMEGAAYVKENSRMGKVKAFVGKAFELALQTAIESAMPRI